MTPTESQSPKFSQSDRNSDQSAYAKLRQLAYQIGLRRPALPQVSGMKLYQRKSAWELNPESCPCDLQFANYLKQAGISGKSIFHFGTGAHHILALKNQAIEPPNEIIGITAAAPEHQAYIDLVLENPAFAKYYKVWFADIYTLTANSLPNFDVVSLFHLCEFYLAENAPLIQQTDASLVQLFLDKLNPEGRILFYERSQAWKTAAPLIESFVQAGKIRQIDQYESLRVYGLTYNKQRTDWAR